MSDPRVLEFGEFWQWLQGHPNCIISAGTPDTALFDHDDFHWTFDRELTPEGQEDVLVQLVRGKQLVGELLIPRQRMLHVQVEPQGDEGEFLFQCFERPGDEDPPGEPLASYYFTLSHGYEELEAATRRQGRWVH